MNKKKSLEDFSSGQYPDDLQEFATACAHAVGQVAFDAAIELGRAAGPVCGGMVAGAAQRAAAEAFRKVFRDMTNLDI